MAIAVILELKSDTSSGESEIVYQFPKIDSPKHSTKSIYVNLPIKTNDTAKVAPVLLINIPSLTQHIANK
jgi:hypothetical protein